MTLVIVAIMAFYSSLFLQIWSLRKKIEKMERIIKSMNDDLNMVSKTVTNQKQILKG